MSPLPKVAKIAITHFSLGLKKVYKTKKKIFKGVKNHWDN